RFLVSFAADQLRAGRNGEAATTDRVPADAPSSPQGAHYLMRRLQRCQCIATFINERLHAGRSQGWFLIALAARKIDVSGAGGFERRRGRHGLVLVDLVGRAEASERRA